MAEEQPCVECGDNDTLPVTGADQRGTKVIKWGPHLLAPIGKPTGDKRRFAAGALTNRDLPLPLKWQRTDSQGHGGSSVIGTIDGVLYDADGAPHGFGLLFSPDPEQLPRLAEDAGEARMLWEQGTVGPSVDLDDMEFHQLDPTDAQYAADQRPEIEVTRGRISAATLVPIPAFAEAGGRVQLTEMEPEEYAAELAAHNAGLTASVRSTWSDLPVASTAYAYDPLLARTRVAEWADGDVDRYARAFLWRDPNEPDSMAGYRFPVADVIDGQLTVVPDAVFRAQAVLSGQRGETVIPAVDQAAMRGVLDNLARQADGEEAELAGALASMSEDEFAAFAELADTDDAAEFGARFERLKASLAAKGIKDPDALAAKIGQHTYGKKGMQRLREGVAASKVKPLHAPVTAAAVIEEAMVAAANLNDAAPAPLPAEWFDDPKLDALTPLTVTPDGRVYGHLAGWRTCHTGFRNACTTAPHSRTNYAYFHTGAVDTTRGQMAVGRVSAGGGHADTRLGFQAATAHYDDTTRQAAVVRAGEDKFGIWVAGAKLPEADRAELMRSPLSGDWRPIGGNLELVHALAVNSPGFPVPRAGMTASGEQTALVAAGVVPVETTGGAAAPIDVKALVIEAVTQYREAEAAFARQKAGLAALAQMDDDGDEDDAARRRLKAKKAALVMAAPGTEG